VLARETQRRTAFSMIVIEILQPNPKAKNVSMAADHNRMEDPLMKPEYPYFSNCSSDGANEDELKAPSSMRRFPMNRIPKATSIARSNRRA
jgi:hypothetical protein